MLLGVITAAWTDLPARRGGDGVSGIRGLAAHVLTDGGLGEGAKTWCTSRGWSQGHLLFIHLT